MEVPGQAIGPCGSLGPWASSPVVSASSFLKEVWKRHGSWALGGTRCSRWGPGAVASSMAWTDAAPAPPGTGHLKGGAEDFALKQQVPASLACAPGARRCWSSAGLRVCGWPQVVSTHSSQR